MCSSDLRHRARECEGCEHDRLIALCHADNAFHHRNIETERRIGIDDREDRRFTIKRRIIDTARNAHKFDGIEITFRAERVSVDRLITQSQHVIERVEMAHARMNIGRLNRIATPEMHGVQ